MESTRPQGLYRMYWEAYISLEIQTVKENDLIAPQGIRSSPKGNPVHMIYLKYLKIYDSKTNDFIHTFDLPDEVFYTIIIILVHEKHFTYYENLLQVFHM